MKATILIASLICIHFAAFCQPGKNIVPDSLKLKIKQIDDYVLSVNKNPNLVIADHITGELTNCGGYTESKTYIDNASKEKLKQENTTNTTTINYYKNGKLIYYQLGNYLHPVLKRVYLQSDKVIFIDEVLGVEVILKISFSFVGGGEGVTRSSSFDITKDTVNFYVTDIAKGKTTHKIETRKALQIWQSLVSPVNIDGIDNVRSTCETAPVDGLDYRYTIKTNQGEYSFINPNTTGVPAIAALFNRIEKLNLYKLLN